MKIKALLVGLLLTSGLAFGQAPAPQTTTQGGTVQAPGEAGDLKAGEGDRTFEVNFTPFDNTPLGLNYLKGRLFLSDDMAARLGISIAYSGANDASIFTWTLAPGIEKHFAQTKRLSPYYGGVLTLANRISSYSPDGGGTEYSGATDAGGSNRGYFSFGLNGVLGCDFYVARNLYLGLEAGYGFTVFVNSTIEATDDAGNTNEVAESSSSFQIGPNINSAIRLGFVF